MKKFFVMMICVGMIFSFNHEAVSGASISGRDDSQIISDIRGAIERHITPWRRDHSKGLMNLDARFGIPTIKIELQKEDCLIFIIFPKGPFARNEAKKFQIDSVQSVLTVCIANSFQPASIRLSLYSQEKHLEGIAAYSERDGMIRWIPQ